MAPGTVNVHRRHRDPQVAPVLECLMAVAEACEDVDINPPQSAGMTDDIDFRESADDDASQRTE
jgi:hypothetical protein